MSNRYYGSEPITSQSQVIRYLTENYVDEADDPVTEAMAMEGILENQKMVTDAINVFKSNVYYVGDQIGEAKGWIELEQEEDDEDEEEDDE